MNQHQKIRECPNCGYDAQSLSLRKCEVCGYDFGIGIRGRRKKKLGKSKLKKIQKSLRRGVRKSLKHPLKLVGVIAILILISGVSLSRRNPELGNSQSLEPVPVGIFDYGGDPGIALLLNEGFKGEIEEKYPSLELRYLAPLRDEDQVAKLIRGEISFIIHHQPLKDRDYEKGRLRGYQLKQLPLGIEGTQKKNSRIFLSYREDETVEAKAANFYYKILTSNEGKKIIQSINLKSIF